MSRAPLTVTIPPNLMGRLRAATFALSGPPTALRLVDIVEQGIADAVSALEARHNGGKPFPSPGEGRLRQGRLST